MKYLRLTLLVLAGLCAISVAALLIFSIDNYFKRVGQPLSSYMFLILMATLLGGAYLIFAKLTITEVKRLKKTKTKTGSDTNKNGVRHQLTFRNHKP